MAFYQSLCNFWRFKRHVTAVRFLSSTLSPCSTRCAPSLKLATSSVGTAQSATIPTIQMRQISTSLMLMKKRARKVKEKLVESEDEEEEEDEEESDEAEEDDGIAKDYREMTLRVSTPRLDVVMAKVLNKGRGSYIEEMFYAGRFKVNGAIAKKKSYHIVNKDEIDFLIGPSPDNPEFSLITRVKIVNFELKNAYKSGQFPIEVKVWPAMVITNWKEEEEERNAD